MLLIFGGLSYKFILFIIVRKVLQLLMSQNIKIH